jgi:hypothetical protein
VVAIASHAARHGAMSPVLVGACCALEPRVLELPGFDPAHGSAAAAGLFRYRWPVRPTAVQLERLLATPLVQGDLALAAALVGALGSAGWQRSRATSASRWWWRGCSRAITGGTRSAGCRARPRRSSCAGSPRSRPATCDARSRWQAGPSGCSPASGSSGSSTS